MSTDREVARQILKRISDTALELAFVRHSLTSDEVDVDADAPVKERVEANEAFCEEVKEDILNCLTGDDTGCLDPEELDATNCELIFLLEALTTARREQAERLIRLLGPDEVSQLAYHALGVQRAFQDSHLFNNTEENGLRINKAIEDVSEIIDIAAAIRAGAKEGKQLDGSNES